MKYKIQLSLLLLLLISSLQLSAGGGDLHSINPVIGNQSYVELTGEEPTLQTNETFRIRLHLCYVEETLRSRDVSHLSPELQARRTQLLDYLHDYWVKGEFPKNYDYTAERRPCFIDKDQNICAVGYLVEQTAGREMAEAINAQFKYDFVMDMQGDALDQWILESGFTKEELAMIQPTYGPTDPNYIPKGYGAASAGVAGLSLGFSALSLSQPQGGKWIPVMGMISGVTSLTMGIVDMNAMPDLDYWSGNENTSRKNLNMFNIGLGTATTLLNTYMLVRRDHPRPKSAVGALYQPLPGGTQAYGLTFNRSF
ncbi:MAG: hypothetical protein H6581_23670 [Bacteroidia bacterium]|nr:hypothetical protein [Bacteroidia bacterium]